MMAPNSLGDRERPQGTLSVFRPASPVEAVKFETFIKITADGSVTAYNGHVDLGTGIRTALGQIVAEELDVSFARVVLRSTVRRASRAIAAASRMSTARPSPRSVAPETPSTRISGSAIARTTISRCPRMRSASSPTAVITTTITDSII